MSTHPPFLSIKFGHGRNLAPKDSNGYSDPYCKFTYHGSKYTTKVKTKTLNPVWNQTFLIGPFNKEDILNIQCYDKDLIKSDDYLGQVNIPLLEFANTNDCTFPEKWYPLQGRGKDELITGDIEISFKVEPYSASKVSLLSKESQSTIKRNKSVVKDAANPNAFVATLVAPAVPDKALGPVREQDRFSLERIAENKENIKNFVNRGSLEGDYSIGVQLGKGAFGEVHEVIHKKTGEKRAIKFINKSGNEKFSNEYIKSTTESEIDILCSVQQENIVQMKDLFIDEKRYCIVLELVTGGELFDKICQLTCYSEQQAAILIKQVFTGIHSLHQSKIAHRDLKPENLLLSSPDEDADIKIADFGLAKKLDSPDQKMYDACGTLMYLAPEVIKTVRAKNSGKPVDGYDVKVDIWSAGVILYIMMCGFPPFYDEDDQQLFNQILKADVEFPSPEWDAVSDQAKTFIQKLIEPNPEKRLSSLEALQDPWLTKGDHNDTNLTQTVAQLKKFNARRKLRSAIFAAKAVSMMKAFKSTAVQQL